MKKSIRGVLVISLAAVLTACGGGGGGSSEGTSPDGSSGGDTGTPPVVLPSPSAASLIGSFIGACAPSKLVRHGGATAPFVNEIIQIENSANSANVAQVTTIFNRTFYASTDTQCAASPIGNIRNASLGSQMNVDATVRAALDGTEVFANQVTITEGIMGGFASGGYININGLTYPGNYFTTAIVHKVLLYVSDKPSVLYSGEGADDANGYPTMPLTPVMTRQ